MDSTLHIAQVIRFFYCYHRTRPGLITQMLSSLLCSKHEDIGGIGGYLSPKCDFRSVPRTHYNTETNLDVGYSKLAHVHVAHEVS